MPDKTLNEVFTEIADAIREKAGTSESMTPLDMAYNISNIESGAIEDYLREGAGMYEWNGQSDETTPRGTLENNGVYLYDSSSGFRSIEGWPEEDKLYYIIPGMYRIYDNLDMPSWLSYTGDSMATAFQLTASNGYYEVYEGQLGSELQLQGGFYQYIPADESSSGEAYFRDVEFDSGHEPNEYAENPQLYWCTFDTKYGQEPSWKFTEVYQDTPITENCYYLYRGGSGFEQASDTVLQGGYEAGSGFYFWDTYSLNSQSLDGDKLYYYENNSTSLSGPVELESGSAYIYEGGSTFTSFEGPTSDGVYLLDDGEWSQVNSGLYFISSTEGGSIWDAAVDGTPIYGQSGYYYYNADSSYFNYLMIDGSPADDLSSDALLWVDPDSSKELKTISLNKGDVYTYEGGSVFEPYEPDFNTILADYITEECGYDLRDAQYVPWLYTAGSGISPVNKGTWVVGHDDVLYDYDFANNKLYWVGNVGDHESAQEDITELQLNSGSTYTYNGDGDFELFTPESPAQENGLYYGNDDGSYTAFSGCLYEGTGLYQLNYDTSARRIVLDAVGDSQVVELNEEHYKVIRID